MKIPQTKVLWYEKLVAIAIFIHCYVFDEILIG